MTQIKSNRQPSELEKFGPNIYELTETLGFPHDYPTDEAIRWALTELLLRREDPDVAFWRDATSDALTRLALSERREKRLAAKLRRAKKGRQGSDWFWTFKILKLKERIAWYRKHYMFRLFPWELLWRERAVLGDTNKENSELKAKVDALTECLNGKHVYRGKLNIPGFEEVEVEGLTFGGEAVAIKRYCQHCYRQEGTDDKNGGDLGREGRGEVSGNGDSQG